MKLKRSNALVISANTTHSAFICYGHDLYLVTSTLHGLSLTLRASAPSLLWDVMFLAKFHLLRYQESNPAIFVNSEAGIPLHHTGKVHKMVRIGGIEPPLRLSESRRLPLSHILIWSAIGESNPVVCGLQSHVFPSDSRRKRCLSISQASISRRLSPASEWGESNAL